MSRLYFLFTIWVDRTVLHDEVLNILIAGRDTVNQSPITPILFLGTDYIALQTAATLTVAVYFLSQHPDMVKRLREEILSTVGPTSRPTYEDIREMKFLRAFINGNPSSAPSICVLVEADRTTIQKLCDSIRLRKC